MEFMGFHLDASARFRNPGWLESPKFRALAACPLAPTWVKPGGRKS
jgi:hypothetical protein